MLLSIMIAIGVCIITTLAFIIHYVKRNMQRIHANHLALQQVHMTWEEVFHDQCHEIQSLRDNVNNVQAQLISLSKRVQALTESHSKPGELTKAMRLMDLGVEDNELQDLTNCSQGELTLIKNLRRYTERDLNPVDSAC